MTKRQRKECQRIATDVTHPLSRLVNAARAAEHVLNGLLACREGTTDVLLEEIRDALKLAIDEAGVRDA